MISELKILEAEKEKNSRLIREVKESKEETAQIRANTQQIISTYQVKIRKKTSSKVMIKKCFKRFFLEFRRSQIKCIRWRAKNAQNSI